MAIRWKLATRLKRLGIENANQLAERAGIGYPAATRIFDHITEDIPLGRFDMRTLDKVMTLLGVTSFDRVLSRDTPPKRR